MAAMSQVSSITEQSLSEANKSLSAQLEQTKNELSKQTSKSAKREAQVKQLKLALTASHVTTPQIALPDNTSIIKAAAETLAGNVGDMPA